MIADALLEQLKATVGAENVLLDALDCQYYAQDVFSSELPAAAVVRPEDKQQLAAVVQAVVKAGVAVVARGGGMSYTGAHVPAVENSIVVDTAGMNRVLELNREDMYITVEAGITWQALYEALQDSGLRTPYWGTLSGIYATVGGSLSQNSIFWGSSQHGTAADSVLSMEVALADGTLLNTGSAAQVNAAPFFRHHGPDLTGLFTCDCGVLGIKATVTLRLIPEYASRAFGSFAFDNYANMLPAMAEIARQNLSMECFGFDPYLQQQRMQRESLMQDAKQVMGVLKAAGGVGKAIKDGAKLAVAGRHFMRDVTWSFHTIIEERNHSAAEECLNRIRAIVRERGGRELADSIPKLVRSNPFGPVNNMIGPHGERWVPLHGLVPHSQAVEVMNKVEAIYDDCRTAIKEYDIGTGYLLATVSTHCSVIEPVIFWPDALEEIHRRSIDDSYLKHIGGFNQNLPARDAVIEIRRQLVEMFSNVGAVHLQLGKSYLYREGLQPRAYSLVQSLKQALDPSHRINPGALGL